jgi:hypothetical protein
LPAFSAPPPPLIALATLILTIYEQGEIFVALEARSMIFGAIAFFRPRLCRLPGSRLAKLTVLPELGQYQTHLLPLLP